jgi:glycosyltransferase involved in cell wall biosynthesis
MPTYNRADVILRAVRSIQAQWFEDWELVVVDDGSTDGTADLLLGLGEPRLRLVRQENQGVTRARNATLREARGELISFLDSDDEWPPHHLALMAAFFDAHPGEHLVTSEWWEDFGQQRYLKHFVVEMREWYPATGRRIGARLFDGPPPDGDPLLRFFEQGEPPGAWAEPVLARTPYRDVRHYRGRVFDRWRWGWITALQPTVLTRQALAATGGFDEAYPVACDFGFLAQACRHHPLHFLTLPGCFKHEFGEGGAAIAEAHLVTGPSAVRFHDDVLRFLEAFWAGTDPSDPELRALRGFRQYWVARVALQRGDRARAAPLVEACARTFPGPEVEALRWILRLAPSDEAARRLFALGLAAVRLPGRVRRLARRLGGDRDV